MSCDTEYLQKQLLVIRKRGLRRFVLYAIVLMIFVQSFQKIMGKLTGKKTQIFQNDVEYVQKSFFWALLILIFWL